MGLALVIVIAPTTHLMMCAILLVTLGGGKSLPTHPHPTPPKKKTSTSHECMLRAFSLGACST